MFTGLIENTASVLKLLKTQSGCRLIIDANFDDLEIGESIAVNGVCLTLLDSMGEGLSFDISPETLRLTNMTDLTIGKIVNLERAMGHHSRFGGHYVTGHVDCCKFVQDISSESDFVHVKIGGFKKEELLFLTPKGSITVNGVSLTINQVLVDTIELMLVPHTLKATNLKNLKAGDNLNIEFDHLAKIVAHQLKTLQKHQLSLEAAIKTS